MPLLGIYPSEKKVNVPTKLCTPMFMAALFIITNNYKYHSQIVKYIVLWYIHVMKYYSTIKRNGQLVYATVLIKFKCINYLYIWYNSSYDTFWKTTETKNRSWLLEVGEKRIDYRVSKIEFGGVTGTCKLNF